ncbi:MAG: DinB family protein [Acidobacteriota bacterium]|nr:DinB family protein [Acidobacteriota bacterium]
MNPPQMDALATEFITVTRAELKEKLQQIEACVAQLTAEQLWNRRHETENAVGNLLLHLRGNVQQWLVCGVGGHSDNRDRDAEFADRVPTPAEDLLRPLRETLAGADAVLAGLSAKDLLNTRQIQGRKLTVLHAIYHVVEHLSGHVGQIIWATKRATGRDLGF